MSSPSITISSTSSVDTISYTGTGKTFVLYESVVSGREVSTGISSSTTPGSFTYPRAKSGTQYYIVYSYDGLSWYPSNEVSSSAVSTIPIVENNTMVGGNLDFYRIVIEDLPPLEDSAKIYSTNSINLLMVEWAPGTIDLPALKKATTLTVTEKNTTVPVVANTVQDQINISDSLIFEVYKQNMTNITIGEFYSLYGNFLIGKGALTNAVNPVQLGTIGASYARYGIMVLGKNAIVSKIPGQFGLIGVSSARYGVIILGIGE